MCFNTAVSSCAHRLLAKCRRRKNYTEVISEQRPLLLEKAENGTVSPQTEILEAELTLKDCEELGNPLLLSYFH